MLRTVVRASTLCCVMLCLLGCATAKPTSHTTDFAPYPAPALQIKSLNSRGTEISLSEFSGKYVLVDFWATWCAPCREEVPYLKETYERFGHDSHFAMLSISLDRGPSAPREYAASRQMNWPQGFAGSPSESEDLTTRWKVDTIPAIFLVDPQGKVIASDLRGEEIGDAVLHALQESQEKISATDGAQMGRR